MGEGNKKLSKRDPQSLAERLPRRRATCPRACSTTWPCWAGRSPTTATCSRSQEMVAAFDVADVNANPARFDLKKCRGDQRRRTSGCSTPDDFARAARGPTCAAAGLAGRRAAVLDAAAPLVQERVQTLGEGVEHARASCSSPRRRSPSTRPRPPSSSARPGGRCSPPRVAALERLAEWTHDGDRGSAEAALVDGLGLKPRQRVRPAAGGGHRAHRVAAAVRVDGDPRPRPVTGPPARRHHRQLTGSDTDRPQTAPPTSPRRPGGFFRNPAEVCPRCRDGGENCNVFSFWPEANPGRGRCP